MDVHDGMLAVAIVVLLIERNDWFDDVNIDRDVKWTFGRSSDGVKDSIIAEHRALHGFRTA